MGQSDIGVIGLAVMGQNLVLNMNDHGYRVSVFNRTLAKVDDFLAGPAAGTRVRGCHSLAELVGSLQRPRRVLLMVQAGEAVDRLIESLTPWLEPGDVLLDGGNSHFTDTTRRTQALAEQGILYLGVGISGGEEGARLGPAIMPGGNAAAWPLVKALLQDIAAKVDEVPCCQWLGPEGSGHFVKMVHNGIEYGDMQLIAEAYLLLRQGLGLEPMTIRRIFGEWNQGVLDSYLIQITADILGRREDDGTLLLDRILDAAGQKGTGKWTSVHALDFGIPLTLVSEAVFARFLSSMKEARQRAAQELPGGVSAFAGDRETAIRQIRDGLYAAKIISYAQGYMLMDAVSQANAWELRLGDIALIWRGGCIIRSRLLNGLHAAYERDPGLENLLFDPYFREAISQCLPGWRQAVGLAVRLGIPTPALASALSFYDGYRCAESGANLIQAQRDYFGNHTYERTDRPRGEFFHTDWTGAGTGATSGIYTA